MRPMPRLLLRLPTNVVDAASLAAHLRAWVTDPTHRAYPLVRTTAERVEHCGARDATCLRRVVRELDDMMVHTAYCDQWRYAESLAHAVDRVADALESGTRLLEDGDEVGAEGGVVSDVIVIEEVGFRVRQLARARFVLEHEARLLAMGQGEREAVEETQRMVRWQEQQLGDALAACTVADLHELLIASGEDGALAQAAVLELGRRAP